MTLTWVDLCVIIRTTHVKRWLMCQASSTSPKTAGVDVLKETLSTFVASFDILDATDDQLYGFRRILTDAVSLKGELVVPVLVALVEKLRSVRYGSLCEWHIV